MRLSDLKASYPEFQEIYRNHFQGARFDTVFRRDGDFGARKLRLVSVQHLLGKHQRLRRKKRAKLVQSLLRGDFNSAQRILGEPKRPSIVFTLVATAVGACPPSPSNDETLKGEMKSLSARLSDSQFLLEMKDVNDEVLQPMIQEIQALSHSLLSPLIDTTVGAMARAVMELQQDVFRRNIQHDIERDEMKRRDEEFAGFVRKLNAQSAWRKDSVVRIYGLATTPSDDCGDSRGWISRSPYRSQEYWVTGRQETFKDYQLEFRVQLMSLSRDDKQNMQLDFNYIPNPIVNDRLSSHFHLPTAMNIAFCQILENERLLLILVDRERIFIYLELLLAIDPAIRRNRPIKSLNRESIGQDILFAYEETKRTLAVCSSRRLQLHVFVFDKTLKTLRAQGSAIDLSPWYSQARISILQVAFVSGKEEMVLVDSSSRARIFSFTSLQFRPASLSVPSLPNAIFSSPDGSCFLTLHNHDSKQSLTAYHWETFGSTHGIPLDVPEFSLQGAVITSMVSRGCIFLISLDVDTGLVRSIAIDITKKVTGFIFKKGGGCAPIKGERRTLHNSLLDCHTEVWTRFPVVPAVKRSTVTSLSEGHQKSLTFITEDHTRPFESYFTNLVQTFETTAKKPTEEELHSIQVSAAQFETFQDNVALNSDWDVSRYRAGEWLVDLLCLIPIHIAVCRENKFIPLADGVLSSDLERTLLGAEVNQIVDKLSFGWYESIFQSYLAAKPVKVVSSMGQQSVGKSFSLNHLLDTSFTGSAMRTTGMVSALHIGLPKSGSVRFFNNFAEPRTELQRPAPPYPRAHSAAVLVALFVGRAGNLYVLLSQRAKTLSSYAGDTALPGGRIDDDGKTIEDTALTFKRREVFEEIGLPQDKDKLPLLCILDPFLAGNEVLVTPVVVLILDNTLKPVLNAPEVDTLFSHPLASFLSTTFPERAEPRGPFLEAEAHAETAAVKLQYHTYSDVPGPWPSSSTNTDSAGAGSAGG
ncbi:hypothetical protein F5888DRAFT_1910021, partial [Russula emetica]